MDNWWRTYPDVFLASQQGLPHGDPGLHLLCVSLEELSVEVLLKLLLLLLPGLQELLVGGVKVRDLLLDLWGGGGGGEGEGEKVDERKGSGEVCCNGL